MTTNLIDVLRKSFTPETYDAIAINVGINPESVKNGINAIIPALLASILGNNTVNSATQPTWWNVLKEEYPYNENEFIDTTPISTSSFLIKSREIVNGLFTSCYDDLVSSISSIGGVQKEKAARLIHTTAPLVIGYLNNWMRRKGWKYKDLINNLFEQKTHIIGTLPMGISPACFEMNNMPKNNFSQTIENKLPATGVSHKKNRNGLMWFIGLVVLGILLWYFLG